MVEKVDKNKINHVAIIMDGNGRWAKKNGLLRIEGHREGAKAVRRVLDAAELFDIKYITLYAFSTENWKRPKLEVIGLMKLLKEFLELNYDLLMEKKVKLRTIGRIDDIPYVTRKVLNRIVKNTSKNTERELILALSYGSRAEIIDATKKIVNAVKNDIIKLDDIDESKFSSFLYAPDIPDPELMIRTSGEYRLSNFMLWQLSYSELWITDTLWPDFGEKEFKEAIESYYSRNRRFGGV
ncbi:MAG TPA: isoprenyl transferase [Victivallales bacterium]|nr:isoprenyl transferase [Victivallales bacterium]